MQNTWVVIGAALLVTGCGGITSPQSAPVQRSEPAYVDRGRDARLAQQIRQQFLQHSATVEGRNLYIHCQAGVVTVKGAVGSDEERRGLMRTISALPAVIELKNEVSLLSPAYRQMFETKSDLAGSAFLSAE